MNTLSRPHSLRVWSRVRLAFALTLALSCLPLIQAQGMSLYGYAGTLGANRIGMTLDVSGGTITGGHYFYARYLKDIALKGSVQNGELTLTGDDGSTFHLKFRSNGSEKGQPLTFENSAGLAGTWTANGRLFMVKLEPGGVSQAPADGRWYSQVTDESDAAFEARAQAFYRAVLADDRAAAAKYVSYPLRVNRNGKSRMIHSPEELSAQWNTIFTPACLEQFHKALPHDMFVSNGLAMLGNGVAWFGPQGVTSINAP